MNPILQAMNMANAMNDPNKMLQQMLNSNPQFRSFYEANKNKTPDEVARAYGLDPRMVSQFIGGQR